MPVIEPSIVSLIVSPDEALCEHVHCPNIECHCTDELFSHAYNSTAFLGWISNSLTHILVVLHCLLTTPSSDPLVVKVLELALQAMGVIANQCGTALVSTATSAQVSWPNPFCLKYAGTT